MYELTIIINHGFPILWEPEWCHIQEEYDFNGCDYDIFSIIYHNESDLNKKIKKNIKFYDILFEALDNSNVKENNSLSENILMIFKMKWYNLDKITSIIQKIPDSKLLNSLHQIFMLGSFNPCVSVKMYTKYRQDLIDFNTRLEYLVNNG